MIGRLAETGDSESSEPHVSVVRSTSNATLCQVIHSNAQKSKSELVDLKEVNLISPAFTSCEEKEDNELKQLDCTLAVSLSHVNAHYGMLSKKTESESSNNYINRVSASENVSAMTTNTSDVQNSNDSEKALKYQVNCSEQECNPYKLCNYDNSQKELVTKSTAVAATSTESSMPDVNPIGSVKVISCDVANSLEDETLASMNVIHEIQKLPSNTNSTVEYHLTAKSSANVDYQMIAGDKPQTLQVHELNTVSISDLFKRTCDDINITYVKNCKSNVSVVKCPPSKPNVSSYLKYSSTALNKQIPLHNRGTSNLTTANTVLNATHTVQRLKANPHVYKVQNVIVKSAGQNANGFLTQFSHSLNPTTSQAHSEVNLNTIGRGNLVEGTASKSVISDYASIKHMTSERELQAKKNRKLILGNQNLHKDSSNDQSDLYQSQTNYSNKLPNIISKVRDNLSENSLKSKPNKPLLNSNDKYSEHSRIVRKYEPKFSSNTLNMEHAKLMKKNRIDHIFNPNRHSGTSKTGQTFDSVNTFTDSVSLDHTIGLASTSVLLNQETYSRKTSKPNIRTGQNNNIDVLPNNWKQTTVLGSTVISENVTPISTSNTWDEIPRLNYGLTQESVTSKLDNVTAVKQSPQILIVRGDSQAPPQRLGCDEEFIGEEIRPERTDHLPPAYHSLQIVLQDHNYGAPPPSTPVVSPLPEIFSNNGNNIELTSGFNRQHVDEDAASVVSIESNNQLNNEEDEETETAPEEENETSDIVDDKNSITRCICDFQHDDGYMIQCGQCLVWQHIVCVGVTPKRIPKKYLCDFCQPRELDRYRAHSLQKMIRDDLNMLTSSDSSPTRSGDKDRVNLKNVTKRRGESSVNFPVTYNTTRNKRIRRDPSPKLKVRRPYKERKKVFRKKIKTDMDRPSVRPWLENYELAVTNHYSQELRARLSGITKKQEERPDFVLTDCTTIPFAGGRIMISTIDILPNTPVIELMGKFMLSSQHQNATALLVGTNSRQVTQKPGPFVFFYRMPQEGTDICIDTRTYGNDARFVRRSCKPNCELHHWFDKGTLHIFLMSIEKIESNTEITLRHELGWHGLGIGRTPSNPCACNSPECLLLNPIQNRKTYISSDNVPSKLRVNKSRTMTSRSFMIKDKSDSPKSDTTLPDDELDEDILNPAKAIDDDHQSDFRTSPIKSSQDSDNTSDDLRKIMASCADTKSLESPKANATTEDKSGNASFSNDPIPSTSRRTRRVYTRRNRVNKKLILQENSAQDLKPSGESADEGYNDLHVKEMKKMTREERKIAQVMKVFDRLEKDKAKRSSGAPRGRRLDSESDHARRDESTDVEHSSANVRVYRPRGKGRRKTQISRDYKQKSRRSISEGGSDDHTSVKKASLIKQLPSESSKNIDQSDTNLNTESVKSTNSNKVENEEAAFIKRGLRKRKIYFPKKQQVQIEEPQQGQQTEEAAGLLLALARSTPANPSDPSPSNEMIESPISNMISVCQLVEAAVGPLETSLKSPKKAILNEWMNKSPESSLAYELAEPTPATYNECNSNSNSPLTLFCLGNESVQNRSIPSSKLLDTLVQAASSICDIGTEYSENNILNSNVNDQSKDNSEMSDSCKNIELNEKPKIAVPVLDTELNISLDQPAMEKSSILPLDNDIAKNNINSLIKLNHINKEKNITSNVILNVTTAVNTLNFVNNDAISADHILFPDSEESILEPSSQAETYESVNTNVIEGSGTTEVPTKNSVVDITTDLSNDSSIVCSTYQGNNGGSAKKRWLHQALSEESDHPLSKASTPLKKRRLVRESTSEIAHLSNDDVNEFTVDTKNFQSATTVATSNDSVIQESLQNKNTVVAENNTNLQNNLVQNENENRASMFSLLNNNPTAIQLNSKNAFDWENLESHDDSISNGQINSIITRTSSNNKLYSLPDNVNCEIEDISFSKSQVSDEIADIHKRLQSFHSENIQVLRSRNQKPKTQLIEGHRKKVNLMFEVSVLEDQTVAVELCNEAKTLPNKISKFSTQNKDLSQHSNSTQIISYDFDEFSRHKSIALQQVVESVNTNNEATNDVYIPDSALSTCSLSNYSSMVISDSNNREVKELQTQDDISINTLKYNTEKHSSLLSFNDIPTKLEPSLQSSHCSPTNVLNKHEIGVAARARLDSILNATDISQDAMFDQVLKKNIHITNHVANVIHNESPMNSPIPPVQTSYVKPMARTSSSDPRLQQVTPIKKKLSLTEYRARKKTDTNGNGHDLYSSSEKPLEQLNVLITDLDEEPNDQENFMFTPEPTLVERELEKHPGFLSRDYFTVPSSITNDLANESETEGSGSEP